MLTHLHALADGLLVVISPATALAALHQALNRDVVGDGEAEHAIARLDLRGTG